MIKRFFSYYAPYRGLFVLDFGCAVVAGLLELVFPLAVAYFIDSLLPRSEFGLILIAGGVLLAIYAVNAVLHAIVNYFGHVLGVADLAARPDRHRAAGRVPVRRHRQREHRLWPAWG